MSPSSQTSGGRRPVGADAASGTRHVFVRELEVRTIIGIYEHEKVNPQRVLVSVDMTVKEAGRAFSDRIGDVVDYERIVKRIRTLCETCHVSLIETLAEHMADACLEDARVIAVKIRIEKPDVFEDCRSVGIEIERLAPATATDTGPAKTGPAKTGPAGGR
ncbi:MAG: dihydroneopterin aldolase [Hyphomicrobiaceae bacterium]